VWVPPAREESLSLSSVTAYYINTPHLMHTASFLLYWIFSIPLVEVSIQLAKHALEKTGKEVHLYKHLQKRLGTLSSLSMDTANRIVLRYFA
jgi:hypothetical protein